MTQKPAHTISGILSDAENHPAYKDVDGEWYKMTAQALREAVELLLVADRDNSDWCYNRLVFQEKWGLK